MKLDRFFIHTPRLIQWAYRDYLWRVPTSERILYLTFDDGPHPAITPWVLDQLRTYNAKATFFCIGGNTEKHPQIFQQVLSDGHATGHHTWNHLNGWNTGLHTYVEDAMRAAAIIPSLLFRPPYGKIKRDQVQALRRKLPGLQVVMWDVLSADYNRAFNGAQCTQHVVRGARSGSVIVFHDSEKAFPNLEVALPEVLRHFSERGYRFCALPAGTATNN